MNTLVECLVKSSQMHITYDHMASLRCLHLSSPFSHLLRLILLVCGERSYGQKMCLAQKVSFWLIIIIKIDSFIWENTLKGTVRATFQNSKIPTLVFFQTTPSFSELLSHTKTCSSFELLEMGMKLRGPTNVKWREYWVIVKKTVVNNG